ncbi:RNA polymerase sigma factor [Rhodohalobacter barkolensis]|uniref:RNA polymerase sigma factor n=1 Tax=Rhodohalobacter barkolensis TaxID=2053187 RepID=A0A2N0VEF6_9BACT|nr:RNA polymerase sigma factor [Rhodohalobacter barkolensis]PKD42563.1 RNA polymerase sigma factor [Rhodohalobacter barkolensis]
MEKQHDSYVAEFVQNGHDKSFQIIAEHWYPAIYRFAYSYFGNRDDASEIAQKTLIKVYQNIRSLKEVGSFKSWIYRIANNLCLDELKRAGRRKSESLSLIPKELKLSELTPVTEIESKELNSLIHQALNRLPEEVRAVVILKQFEEMTFSEIGDTLQIPEGTAKTRMYKGLDLLGSILKQWNIETDYLNYD